MNREPRVPRTASPATPSTRTRPSGGTSAPEGSQDARAFPRMVEGGLVTVDQLARVLGMSKRWIHERTRRGEIPCYRFGMALRFDLEEIRGWIVQYRVGMNGTDAGGTR